MHHSIDRENRLMELVRTSEGRYERVGMIERRVRWFSLSGHSILYKQTNTDASSNHTWCNNASYINFFTPLQLILSHINTTHNAQHSCIVVMSVAGTCKSAHTILSHVTLHIHHTSMHATPHANIMRSARVFHSTIKIRNR